MKRFHLLQIICDQTNTKLYFIDKQNMIPVCVSTNGIDYTNKTNITLKGLVQIKDICKNDPSNHYMFTPGTIKKLGVNINGSTIEAFMQAKLQEINSFIKCVLPKHCKNNALMIKN